MRHIQRTALLLALAMVLTSSMTACKDGEEHPSNSESTNGGIAETVTGNPDATAQPETAPTVVMAEAPVVGHYSVTTETRISLGDTISISGEGAAAEGSLLTISRAGAYVLEGTLNGGQIVVDTPDEEKVTLILNGISVSCPDGPALLVKSAPKKVVIYTAEGSVNILSDGTGYVVPDEEQAEGGLYPNACIYACEDLDFDGSGELHVTGNADKGINSKDDVKIKGGSLVISSVGAGIRGNDSVTVSGGVINLTAGGDGIKTANTETEGKGALTVEGGSLFITAMGDGLSAATDLTVTGGQMVLTTTDTDGVVLEEAKDNAASSSGSGFGGASGEDRPGGGRPGGGFGGPGGMMGESEADKAAISAKGMKATGTLTVDGGKITIVAQDDGLHSDGDAVISDGTIHIRAADDGIHAEKELTISGGVLTVAQSYEGVEALRINILGGTNRITSSDDGANATNGSGGGMMGGRPGGMGGGFWGGSTGSSSSDSATSAETPVLTFAGGYTVFNAAGDGIDSNGNIVMTGGTVLVYGPTDNGNGPIDFGDGGYGMTIAGGTFLAVGSSGMAETAQNAGQAVLAAYWRSGLAAGGTVGIADKDGKVIAAFELPKTIASIVFSSPDLKAGETYTVVGGGSTSAEVTDGVIDPATYTGFEVMGEIEAY